MKFLALLALLSVAFASPQGKGKGGKGGGAKGGGDSPGGSFGNRGKSTENDLKEGACKDIYFIMARASTEPGNMGGSMGPIVCRGLREAYPDRVGCQGVGGPYTAGLMDNVSPKGTTAGAINEAKKNVPDGQHQVSQCHHYIWRIQPRYRRYA
jgi:cutinase